MAGDLGGGQRGRKYVNHLLSSLRAPPPSARQNERASGQTRIGENHLARQLGGEFALTAGNLVGIGRGAVHAAEGVAAGANLGLRLALHPLDRLTSPPGQRATDQVAAVTGAALNYAKNGFSNPQDVARDLKRAAHRARIDLDPRATPVADTFAGELRRNFYIGKNQGETLFNVGSLAVGGPYAKAVGRFVDAKAAATPAKYIAQGYSERAANYLAEPYPAKGKGHHFVPQDRGLPKWYSDGEFNVLRPPGISRGDFYELHSKVDRRYGGAKLPKKFGGEHWTAAKSGIQTYGPLGRLVHGSPGPLKARVGGLAASVGEAAYNFEDRHDR